MVLLFNICIHVEGARKRSLMMLFDAIDVGLGFINAVQNFKNVIYYCLVNKISIIIVQTALGFFHFRN